MTLRAAGQTAIFIGSLTLLGVTAYLLFLFLHQWVWVILFLMFFAASLGFGLWYKNNMAKTVLYHFAAFFFALMLFEAHLELMFKQAANGSSLTGTGDCFKAGYYGENTLLGFGPYSDGEFMCGKKDSDDKWVYNVTYSIQDGKRVTPNHNEKSAHAALFFGGSFMFGEGVSDRQTLPYFFNDLHQGQYRVFNFGFHGYGPHQMLAQIRHQVPEKIDGLSGDHVAVYTFIPDHINRAAGVNPWGRNGPRFILEDDKLVHAGTFNHRQSGEHGYSAVSRRVYNALERSRIFYQLFISRPVSHDDIRLAAEIIKESRDLLRERDIPLYVAVWDLYHIGRSFPETEHFEFFIRELKDHGIPLVFAGDVIDADRMELFTLHEYDAHPNAEANQRLARLITQKINGKSIRDFTAEPDRR